MAKIDIRLRYQTLGMSGMTSPHVIPVPMAMWKPVTILGILGYSISRVAI
jgi:hypothetical protein